MDHPTFSIRLATKADTDSVLDCLRSAFAAYEVSYSAEAYADTVMTPDTLARRTRNHAHVGGDQRVG